MPSAEYWFHSHDGLKLFSRVFPGPAPDAPAVLCLHGLMRTGRDFEELAPHLAQRYRVIVPDVRGRGLSARDPNPENYQIPVYLHDLDALMTGLGIARAAIVGTSMGGLMAMTLAVVQPARVTRMVLNDVGPEIDPTGLERIRGYAGKSAPVKSWTQAVAQLRTIYEAVWPDLADERWQVLVRRSYRLSDGGQIEPDADARIADALRSPGAAALDLWSWWKTLRQPVLVLRGAISDVLSPATLARMAREKPDLRQLVVDARGHVPLLDEPQCLSAIDTFLAGQ
jgi:pimeloyl-ACP methyl ester carboxylesterase